MPQCRNSHTPPPTILSLQPAPLCAHISQLPLQLIHLGLGFAQLVLIGAAQLFSIGLHATSKAYMRQGSAQRAPSQEGLSDCTAWDLTALLSKSLVHTVQVGRAWQSFYIPTKLTVAF